ncbi:cytidylyltransferase domain-containing protein [Bradyrhizobium sp. BR 10261]|uniref:cytidylyltransferase domain-containing protein n=1 Tax=Bradyrhizobium sp. BR 10261 TaxID=2749992 RepID=UPI001C64520C|nr:acylneuraminate cytidylyltransferase [Bradyrhizobium sp. BR 10261]MBW7961130.1 acylneuraminate cytidylyltransferase [Bradyrhizobium sp. BR 10261]
MTTGVVIQARMGSTRLPGKVLKPIAGRPLLDHVVGRLSMMRANAVPIVATTVESKDDIIARRCTELGVECFRGSELDVLARFTECARVYALDHIVRLTADNPFTDIEELDRLIELHLAAGNDYTHSFGVLPVGVGAEIFSRAALESSNRDGHRANHREHVNEYIQENPAIFRIGQLAVPAAKNHPEVSLTVDTEADYVRACRIAESRAGCWISTVEALAYDRALH